MGDNTGIEWTDDTWNPIVGCSVVSPGCTNCYAMKMAARLEAMAPKPDGRGNHGLIHYHGTTKDSRAGAVWTGKVALAPDNILLAPLRKRRPRRIFVNSMGDLFHESVPDDGIDKVFAVMALSPQHTFQVLTKRSKRMREYVGSLGSGERPDRVTSVAGALGWTARGYRGSAGLAERPLPNVWLGVSAEDQARANERIPDLLATPAAVRFVSAEPLLGPIYIPEYMPNPLWNGLSSWKQPEIDWIIVGGESGPRARPMHPDWARSLRDQCAAAGVPFFFKQWGEWSPIEIVDEDEDGRLGPAYPLPGCSAPATHKAQQECLFWQGGDLVHWPKIGTVPAIGVRRVGKRATGRLLDGREHNDMPKAIA
jgi:protein gp37